MSNFYRHLIKPFSKLPSPVRGVIDVAAVTIASQLAVSPIIAYTFNRISIAGIFCNLLVVPLAGIITITGIVHYVIFKVAPMLLPVSTFVNYWLVHVQNNIVIYFAGLPHSSIRVPTPPPVALAGYYIAVWGLVRPVVRTRIILGCLGVALVLYGFISNHIPLVRQPQTFEIATLRLGSADAMILSMPNGAHWLVDAGIGGKRAKEDVISEYLWHKGIGSLDTVLITGTGNDRTAGLLNVIDHFSPRRIIMPHNLTLNLKTISVIQPIDYYTLTEGSITVRVWPITETSGKKEKLSLVTQISTPKCTTLFCGDIGKKRQHDLSVRIGAALNSDIMTLPAHGKVALANDFLATVSPKLIIASTGKKKLPEFSGIPTVTTNENALRVFMQGTTIQTEILNLIFRKRFPKK